jgi:GNAT superfamily N-acetyltransferase
MDDLIFALEHQPYKADVQALRHGLARTNIERAPSIMSTPLLDFAVFVRDRTGQISGGCVAEISWGWLYIDTLWLSDDLRGQGTGSRLLRVAEQEAVRRGIVSSYLFTTSFQALPFYLKQGYELWGELQDCPPGHTYYYLRKQHIAPAPADTDFEIQIPPAAETVQTLTDGLIRHARENVALEDQHLAVFIRKPGSVAGDGNILGGILGSTYWGWFDLRFLWVDASLRGQGCGRRLYHMAEAECIGRGVRNVFTDTADFQAPDFYEGLSFEVVGTLPDRPPGHTSYFLRKMGIH